MCEQAGTLERRRWTPEGPSSQSAPQQQEHLCISKLRCRTHISAAQLEAAYAEFRTKKIPDIVLAAAQLCDGANDSEPLQPAQTAHLHAATHRQTSDPEQAQPSVHTSVTAGAVNGMAAPAYATQMDSPNDVLDAPSIAAASGAAAAAAGMGTLSAGQDQSAGKRTRSEQQEIPAGVPSKKAKSGELVNFITM